jgi:Putative zinc-finger
VSAEGCERVRELAPELALGIADGEERAEALEHLGACADCRRYLEELSTTADELLLLAPEQEPPVGFEARVVDQIAPRKRRRRWGIVTAGAATAVAAAAAALAVWAATADDRDLAGEYRDTLAVANGRYFAVAPLEAPGHREVGDVFGYQGSPSWVLVVASPREEYAENGGELRPGTYQVQLLTTAGKRLALGPLEVTDGSGTAAHTLPVDYDRISEVRLFREGGGEVAGAELGD